MIRERLGTGLEGLPAELWKRLRCGRPRLLLLDYDGTLAPFEVDRMQARMPERSRRALERIATDCGDVVGIVSGRPLAELEILAGDLPVNLVGSHGWERRTPDGDRVWSQPPPLVLDRLALARQAAEEAGWEALIEAKPAGVMLHTRGLPETEARRIERECERLWRPLFHRDGLSLDRVDGGVHLHASAHDKGRVVREMYRLNPAVRLVAYLGDDASDESAFEALRIDGLTLHVGADARPSRALWRIDSPEVVSHFLDRWARTAN